MKGKSLKKITPTASDIPPGVLEVKLTAEPIEINHIQFSELLTRIFEEEARRLGLTPLRYEYSNINRIYRPSHRFFKKGLFYGFNFGDSLTREMIGDIFRELNWDVDLFFRTLAPQVINRMVKG